MDTRFYYRDPGAPSPNRPPLIGSVAIIAQGERVLLEQRSDSERWAFIGGGMDDDESAEDAVVREMHEETNLSAKRVRLLGVATDPTRIISYPSGDVRRVITFVFQVKPETFIGMQASAESRSLSFFSLDEIGTSCTLAESHTPVLEIAQATGDLWTWDASGT